MHWNSTIAFGRIPGHGSWSNPAHLTNPIQIWFYLVWFDRFGLFLHCLWLDLEGSCYIFYSLTPTYMHILELKCSYYFYLQCILSYLLNLLTSVNDDQFKFWKFLWAYNYLLSIVKCSIIVLSVFMIFRIFCIYWNCYEM